MEIQKNNNFNSFFPKTKYRLQSIYLFICLFIYLGVYLATIKNKKPLKKKKQHNTTDNRLAMYSDSDTAGLCNLSHEREKPSCQHGR